MKKYLLLPLLLLTFIVIGGSASAAEITPTADSYSFGSTSEMSASTTYDEERGSSSLADTGDTSLYIIVGSVALVIVGGFAIQRVIKQWGLCG